MRTNPSLLRILLVKLVDDFPTFHGDGIKPRRRKLFQGIRGLRVNHANPEIDVIADEGDHQSQNKAPEYTFGEQAQAGFLRHRVQRFKSS